jgi:GDP-L-fucose synthase
MRLIQTGLGYNMPSIPYELKGKKIFVAGHKGMVGSSIVRRLASEQCTILTVEHESVDLCRQDLTEQWFQAARPDVVIVAAARAGGIPANLTRPGDFLFENLTIELNVIHASYNADVEKLLFIGSSTMYPKLASQPLREDSLLTGPLEPTSEAYAIAKIAGAKMCEAYRSQYGSDYIVVIPSNLYGPGDDYRPEYSHVIASLIAQFHEAKSTNENSVTIRGTGTLRREFLYVEDFADACIYLLKNYSDEALLNVGTGEDMTIADLAITLANTVGYTGEINFDAKKPEGAPRKLLDVSRLSKVGWRAPTHLIQGLVHTYSSYLNERRRTVDHNEPVKGDYAEMQVSLDELETVLQKIQPVSSAIGGNKPPENVGVPPYSDEDDAVVKKAISVLRSPESELSSNPERAKEAAEKLKTVGAKIFEFLKGNGQLFADAFSKEAGKRTAQVIVAFSTWQLFGEKLMSAYSAVEAFFHKAFP